jgi:hypothetical protein
MKLAHIERSDEGDATLRELTHEELTHVAGGASDSFMWFPKDPPPPPSAG